mmetsp:Transcript_10755/g.25533  ORF Transcript_10755/g.25533 Transcript_10755/m.25533 type:complete len:231 (-) Transcript_10755:720-1412(-)
MDLPDQTAQGSAVGREPRAAAFLETGIFLQLDAWAELRARPEGRRAVRCPRQRPGIRNGGSIRREEIQDKLLSAGPAGASLQGPGLGHLAGLAGRDLIRRGRASPPAAARRPRAGAGRCWSAAPSPRPQACRMKLSADLPWCLRSSDAPTGPALETRRKRRGVALPAGFQPRPPRPNPLFLREKWGRQTKHPRIRRTRASLISKRASRASFRSSWRRRATGLSSSCSPSP